MKDFIPYNEALELKELGFDEPCFGWYTFGYLRIGAVVENKHVQGEGELLAPLYSQAFRWFREKHNLHSCVAPVYEDEIKKVIVYWFWIQGFDSFEDEDINYKTYEEAELACLNKLIQIVQNGKS